jgi:hypothetical protein
MGIDSIFPSRQSGHFADISSALVEIYEAHQKQELQIAKWISPLFRYFFNLLSKAVIPKYGGYTRYSFLKAFI